MQSEKQEVLSIRLCEVLDSLGYNKSMAEIRRHAHRQINAVVNSIVKNGKSCAVGSLGEGLSKFYESDIDELFLLPNILCFADNKELTLEHYLDENTTLFGIRNILRGHCTLELLRMGKNIDEDILSSIVLFQDKFSLSSRILVNRKLIDFAEFGVRMQGPSTTNDPWDKEYFEGLYPFDHVITLSARCQGILLEWYRRKRLHDWPSASLQDAVVRMDANLVATGPANRVGWRFCFNDIESLLIESLNDTQTKIYKMLKMINNDILKVRGHNITSYMLKNIVFWLAEVYPQSEFRPETLFKWIQKSLRILQRAATMNNIPYYMIPDRNLFKEKVKAHETRELIKDLTSLIEIGPKILVQCKKVSETMRMVSQPDLASFLERNREFEVSFFKAYIQFISSNNGEGSDKDTDHKERVRKLMGVMALSIRSTGWPPHIQCQLNKCLYLGDACRVLLSNAPVMD